MFGLCALALTASAQQDPVLLTIDDNPVTLSEFLYSYRKNNAEGVVDKKNLEEYIDLFVNYKLKVQAALDARLDTLSSFREEYASYRDPQILPSIVTDADVETEAQRIYAEAKERAVAGGGLVKPAHIVLALPQQAKPEQGVVAKARIDSIYRELQAGKDFAELANLHSDDRGSAAKGGELPWLESTQVFSEFSSVVWKLQKDEVSEPFQTPAGWHIAKVLDRCDYVPYDSVKTNIVQFIDRVGIKQQLFDKKLQAVAEQQGSDKETVLRQQIDELTSTDADLKNLLREYHDGLLLFEISNRTVWENTASDEPALQKYFKAHKKQYTWDQPRFKGIAYHVKDAADVKAVKKAVKGSPFGEWNEKLRTTFNNDSILRIRVEKGYFKKGDSPLVDREVFGLNTTVKTNPDYPIDAVFGKLLKAPVALEDVRQQVVSDLQEEREKEWVKQLRQQHRVVVNQEVLSSIKE